MRIRFGIINNVPIVSKNGHGSVNNVQIEENNVERKLNSRPLGLAIYVARL